MVFVAFGYWSSCSVFLRCIQDTYTGSTTPVVKLVFLCGYVFNSYLRFAYSPYCVAAFFDGFCNVHKKELGTAVNFLILLYILCWGVCCKKTILFYKNLFLMCVWCLKVMYVCTLFDAR